MDYPFRGQGHRYADYGKVTASATNLTQLTAPLSNNEKGAWLEIVPSLAIDATGVLIHALAQSTANRSYLFDIGVGASGSEVAVIQNLFTTIGTSGAPICYHLPLSFPAATRISARYQVDDITSADLRVAFTGYMSGHYTGSPYHRIITLGANTAASRGTRITPVNGSKGDYAALTSSLSHDIHEILIVCGNSADFTLNATSYQVDVAVGLDLSEQVIIPDLRYVGLNTIDIFEPNVIGPFPVSISAGSRIAMRAQANSINTDNLDFVLYGLS